MGGCYAPTSSFLETANIFAAQIDQCGLVVNWNKWASKLTGHTKDEVVGNPFSNYLEYNHMSSDKDVLDEWLEKACEAASSTGGGVVCKYA